MYIVIVAAANTRGPEDPAEAKVVDTLKEALSLVKAFAKQYLSNPDNQYTIKIMPTSIF